MSELSQVIFHSLLWKKLNATTEKRFPKRIVSETLFAVNKLLKFVFGKTLKNLKN